MALSRAQLLQAISHLEAGHWQAAHDIVQRDEGSPHSCWAHGIVHLMEGDAANAGYWYAQAKRQFPEQPDASAETRALKATVLGQE